MLALLLRSPVALCNNLRLQEKRSKFCSVMRVISEKKFQESVIEVTVFIRLSEPQKRCEQWSVI
jgi:hypothetical protein